MGQAARAFSGKTKRSRAVASALMMSTAIIAGVVIADRDAVAQSAAQASFNVPAGPLNRALTTFGRQSGLQVTYLTSIGAGKTTAGVSGPATREQALARILQGTGLSYQFTNATTVAISQQTAAGGGTGGLPAGAIPLDTIDVQGETAWGPVDGFVANRSATGTKTDTPLIEVPQSVSVVTRDQMETRKVETLTETLRYTPGVFDRGGYQSNSPDFQVRGFNTTPWTGAFYLNGLRTIGNGDIEPYGLERAEVMRGPSSVLYGQGGPGGVIGLVTKRPTEKPMREVQLQGGNFDQKGGAFDFSGPVTEDKTLLYRFTGLLREGGNGIDFSNDKRAFLSGALTWRPTAATEITAFSLYQKGEGRWNYGLPARGTALSNPNGQIPITRFIGEPAYDRNATELTVVGYNLQHRATENLTFRQNLQYAREIWDFQNVAPTGLRADMRTLNRYAYKGYYTFDTVAVDNQAELKVATGPLQHTVLLGVDYRWRKYDELYTYNGVVGPIDVYAPVYGQSVFMPNFDQGTRQIQNLAGIYLQDQIKLERWILTLGGRYDWANSNVVDSFSGVVTNPNDNAFTKRAGLGYEFDSGLVPYISYSESFTPLTGTTFDGSPYKPETGTQYEAGIKYQPTGAKWRITAAVYDLRRQNVTTTDPDHPGKSIQTGEVTSRGFEFEAVASLTNNLNLTAAYSYNDTRVTKSNSADLGKRPTRNPPHLASLWADYTIREGALNGLGFGGGVRYVSASAGDYLNTFEAPAYTLVDAMVRYDIDNWRFSVNATNLFDKYYVGACFSSAQCNVGRGRTVIGKVSYRW
jgi:iron complex outermembrane receptor protein